MLWQLRETRDARNIYVAFHAIGSDSLNLNKAFTHDKVNCLATNVVTMQARDNLAERFNKAPHLDSSNGSSLTIVSKRKRRKGNKVAYREGEE